MRKIMVSESQMLEMLRQSEIRPSIHRLAVLDYVANRQTHPTAEEVYKAILADFPNVSKTTVYNSLHAMAEAHILRELEIESGSTRYDLALQAPHSHFRCTSCGRIFDMNLPSGLDNMVSPGFKVEATDLFFAGLCPRCAKNN